MRSGMPSHAKVNWQRGGGARLVDHAAHIWLVIARKDPVHHPGRPPSGRGPTRPGPRNRWRRRGISHVGPASPTSRGVRRGSSAMFLAGHFALARNGFVARRFGRAVTSVSGSGTRISEPGRAPRVRSWSACAQRAALNKVRCRIGELRGPSGTAPWCRARLRCLPRQCRPAPAGAGRGAGRACRLRIGSDPVPRWSRVAERRSRSDPRHQARPFQGAVDGRKS